MDTPGFSSMFTPDIEANELKDYFPEFALYEDDCKFWAVSILEKSVRSKSAVAEERSVKAATIITAWCMKIKAEKEILIWNTK